jgi:hypothetical protein
VFFFFFSFSFPCFLGFFLLCRNFSFFFSFATACYYFTELRMGFGRGLFFLSDLVMIFTATYLTLCERISSLGGRVRVCVRVLCVCSVSCATCVCVCVRGDIHLEETTEVLSKARPFFFCCFWSGLVSVFFFFLRLIYHHIIAYMVLPVSRRAFFFLLACFGCSTCALAVYILHIGACSRRVYTDCWFFFLFCSVLFCSVVVGM